MVPIMTSVLWTFAANQQITIRLSIIFVSSKSSFTHQQAQLWVLLPNAMLLKPCPLALIRALSIFLAWKGPSHFHIMPQTIITGPFISSCRDSWWSKTVWSHNLFFIFATFIPLNYFKFLWIQSYTFLLASSTFYTQLWILWSHYNSSNKQ